MFELCGLFAAMRYAEGLPYLRQLAADASNQVINQPVKTKTRETQFTGVRVWRENYFYETEQLAKILYVPNYQDEGMMRYRFERSGGSYIMTLPGPADTSVSTKIWTNENLI